MIPLSLRACKGEGEERTEAHVGALHPRGPLVRYWGVGRGMHRTPHSEPGRGYPLPHTGTLTPLVPLSLRAVEGEGEIRTEADVGAEAPTSASSSVLG